MMRMILGMALLALVATAQAQGELKGDPERAKQKISMCAGCHGIPDYRTAFPDVYYVPMIADQNPGYIVKALEAYKSGERNHPSMRAIAATLSPQDMADLGVYYGTVAK